MPPRAIYERSGPAELVLEGENLTPDTLKLYHNGVLYTPLESSDTYAYYLLGDNGTNKVMLNGKNFSTVIVKDVVVPGLLTGSGFAGQYASVSLSSEKINSTFFNNANCINYPFLFNEDYPVFTIAVGFEESPSSEDYTFVNCNREGGSYFNKLDYLLCKVTDTSKPAYITYQGFIIAVFNYHA